MLSGKHGEEADPDLLAPRAGRGGIIALGERRALLYLCAAGANAPRPVCFVGVPARLPPRVSLIVVAAGRGARLGAATPKQYLDCAGKPLLCHALEALASTHDYSAATVVIHPDDRAAYDGALTFLSPAAAACFGPPALGGASRQQSVLAGLETQSAAAPDLVLIHDGVRVFPTRALIARAIEAAERTGAALPATPLRDSIKHVDEAGRILASPDRAALRAVQTPQTFRFDLILAAHRRAAREGVVDLTDDGAVAAWAGHATYVFDGDPENAKVTTLQDLRAAEARLTNAASDIRVGQGFDVHVFAPGDCVWLGGVRIPHDQSLSRVQTKTQCSHKPSGELSCNFHVLRPVD